MLCVINSVLDTKYIGLKIEPANLQKSKNYVWDLVSTVIAIIQKIKNIVGMYQSAGKLALYFTNCEGLTHTYNGWNLPKSHPDDP